MKKEPKSELILYQTNALPPGVVDALSKEVKRITNAKSYKKKASE